VTSYPSEVVPAVPDLEPPGRPQAPATGVPRTKPSMGALRRTVREVGLALITLGVIVLLFVVYQLFGTGLAEAHSQSVLGKQFTAQVAVTKAHATPSAGAGATATRPGSAPTAPVVTPLVGNALDRLVIPKIGVNKIVVEGVNEDDLRKGPGHYSSTVLPGEKGNAAIAGHRTTYGAPFFRLNELSVGDPIYVTDTAGRTFVYKVSQAFVVSPSDVAVLDPTPWAQLTLTTCNPRFSASTRLVVVARLAGGDALPASQPAGTGSARAPAASVDNPTLGHGATGRATEAASATPANLGSGDSGAWPPALGFAALVLLLWVGVRIWINRTRRWHRVAAYVVGIGICLVPLWFCFENVVLLLPQSI
jgi:sortase A